MALPKMRMKRRRVDHPIWVFLAGLIFLGAGCGEKKEATSVEAGPSQRIKAEDRLVLKIEETEYWSSDFRKYIQTIFGEGEEALEPLTLSRLYDEFFESKLLVHAARRKGIMVSEEEKNEYLKKLGQGSAEEEAGELWEYDSGDLSEKLMIEKYLSQLTQNVTVEEEEIRRYYELHKSEFFLPERIQVSQILLQTEAEAIDIWEKVKSATEEEFRAAARTKSIGPEAAHGGEMGIFQKGQLPQEMETVIFSLTEGEVSPVVESSYGFHIFRLDRKFESEWLSLEEASPSIRRILLDVKTKQAIQLHLRSLEASLGWQMFPENLFFPYQRNKE